MWVGVRDRKERIVLRVDPGELKMIQVNIINDSNNHVIIIIIGES